MTAGERWGSRPGGAPTTLPDYHTHTARCGHAVGDAADYVAQARLKGLTALGLSDHLPLLPDPDPELTMSQDELEGYVTEGLALKDAHPDFVFLGIEADYRPHTVEQVAALLESHPFDYVIGSVHFLDDWAFDDPRFIDGFTNRDIDELYDQYFELVGQAAESGLFTVLGHLDLPKKFGHRPQRSLEQPLERLARRIARSGTAVELNTAGLRKPVGEIYPALDVLRVLRRHEIPITFGSDAHAPVEVGQDFALAAAHAARAGYDRYMQLAPRESAGRALLVPTPLPLT